jgi:hypothetical protein
MPRRKHDKRVYELAKRGAEVQFRDLLHEAKILVDLFPHLHDAFDKDELPISFIIRKGAGAGTKTGRRGPMSAAARAKISAAQKRRWAKQRAGKK